MAESAPPSDNKGTQPASSSSSAAAAPDWEMLSMSMSSSSLGKPRDDGSHKSNTQNDSPNERDSKEADSAPDAQTNPLHANITSEEFSTDAEAEPFTEGWKPHRSSSSGLYGHVSEPSRKEGTPLSNESNATPNTSDYLFLAERDDGGVGKRAFDQNRSAEGVNVEGDFVKKKAKRQGEKNSKRLSTVVWSIAVVAGVTGIFFLGNRLRMAYNQNQQLEIQLSEKDEKLNEMLVQVNRLKEVLRSHHKAPLLRD